MTSYQIRLSDKQRKIGRIVMSFQRELARAVNDAKEARGITQQELAHKIGVDRAVINRRVTGKANLTLRSIAELAWALDQDVVFEFLAKDRKKGTMSVRRRHVDTWLQETSFHDDELGVKEITRCLEDFERLLLAHNKNNHKKIHTVNLNDNWIEVYRRKAEAAA